tara:strand:- start:410 stop:1138 length:729 start_codon:yes stop_codon:yes gene_type:complete
MTFICNNCFKNYTRKDFYEKHITLCKVIKERKLENNNQTCSELYEIIKELTSKYSLLSKQNKLMHEEINKIKNILYQKTENIQVISKNTHCIEWLNNNCENYMNLFDWVEKKDINETLFFRFVNSNDFSNGILNILFQNEEEEKIPIHCFKEKQNNLFIKINNDWKIMDKDNFIQLMQIMQKKLIQYFTKWQCENIIKIKENSYYSELYNNYLQLIIGQNLSCNDNYSKMKNNIFEKLINLE